MKQQAIDFDTLNSPAEATQRLSAGRGDKMSPIPQPTPDARKTDSGDHSPSPPPVQLSEADRQSFGGLEWYLARGN
jgi:hypothetical protein